MKYLLIVEFLGSKTVLKYDTLGDAVRVSAALMIGYSECDAVRVARIIPVEA